MDYRWTFFPWIALAVSSAGAIDIPMNRDLALEGLDSKTCYSTVRSQGKLVGYELQELLVSSGGQLLKLQATGAFTIGKRKPRRYIGDGIEVTITPQKVLSHEDDIEEQSVVLEEGFATIRDHGRRQRIRVKVIEVCTS